MPQFAAMDSWHIQGVNPGMKDFHLPLPGRIYAQLRVEAERTKPPATALAREAIDWRLGRQLRKARHEVIALTRRRPARISIWIVTRSQPESSAC